MRDKLLRLGVKNIKLILKGGGAIEGNFFLVDGAVGTEEGIRVGLAVTQRVAGKDPTGMQLKGMGLKLRRLNKGAPFTWGRIQLVERRLVFYLEGKKLSSPKKIRTLLRGLSKDGTFSALAKAKIVRGLPGESDEAETGLGFEEDIDTSSEAALDGESLADDELSEASLQTDDDLHAAEAEVEALLDDDPELLVSTQEMEETFSQWEEHQEEEALVRAEAIARVSEKVDALWPVEDGKPRPLRAVPILAADPDVQLLRDTLQGPLTADPPWLRQILIHKAHRSQENPPLDAKNWDELDKQSWLQEVSNLSPQTQQTLSAFSMRELMLMGGKAKGKDRKKEQKELRERLESLGLEASELALLKSNLKELKRLQDKPNPAGWDPATLKAWLKHTIRLSPDTVEALTEELSSPELLDKVFKKGLGRKIDETVIGRIVREKVIAGGLGDDAAKGDAEYMKTNLIMQGAKGLGFAIAKAATEGAVQEGVSTLGSQVGGGLGLVSGTRNISRGIEEIAKSENRKRGAKDLILRHEAETALTAWLTYDANNELRSKEADVNSARLADRYDQLQTLGEDRFLYKTTERQRTEGIVRTIKGSVSIASSIANLTGSGVVVGQALSGVGLAVTAGNILVRKIVEADRQKQSNEYEELLARKFVSQLSARAAQSLLAQNLVAPEDADEPTEDPPDDSSPNSEPSFARLALTPKQEKRLEEFRRRRQLRRKEMRTGVRMKRGERQEFEAMLARKQARSKAALAAVQERIQALTERIERHDGADAEELERLQRERAAEQTRAAQMEQAQGSIEVVHSLSFKENMGHRFHTNEETAGTRSRELKAAIARELMKRIEACGRRHRTETCPKIDGTDESIASLAEVTEAVCVDCANLKEVLAVCGISSEQFSRAIQKAIQMLAKAVPEGPDHPSWQALLPAYTEGVLVLIIPDA